MVADIFELNGWDGHFIGANVPADDLARFIQEVKPDVVGLSLSILSNIDNLIQTIQLIRADFPNVDLLVGGQAFRWGGVDSISRFNIEFIPSLNQLESMLKSN